MSAGDLGDGTSTVRGSGESPETTSETSGQGKQVDGPREEVQAAGLSAAESHWVRWHRGYEDPDSNLTLRLRTVQRMVAQVLDGTSPHSGPIRVISMCSGQGRDVIDVVASHPRRADVSAILVELDPALVAFARQRASSADVSEYVRVEHGDASLCHLYSEYVPADLVLVCGVFGNISASDIESTIQALRGFCRPGGHVIWTRHRRQPDATPSIRAEFAASGFGEVEFVAPESTVMTVGHHRLEGPTTAFDPDRRLFDFVGDGFMPA
jgi:ubiquinone/menaquinone biosynthesis C-methylase UbiE